MLECKISQDGVVKFELEKACKKLSFSMESSSNHLFLSNDKDWWCPGCFKWKVHSAKSYNQLNGQVSFTLTPELLMHLKSSRFSGTVELLIYADDQRIASKVVSVQYIKTSPDDCLLPLSVDRGAELVCDENEDWVEDNAAVLPQDSADKVPETVNSPIDSGTNGDKGSVDENIGDVEEKLEDTVTDSHSLNKTQYINETSYAIGGTDGRILSGCYRRESSKNFLLTVLVYGVATVFTAGTLWMLYRMFVAN